MVAKVGRVPLGPGAEGQRALAQHAAVDRGIAAGVLAVLGQYISMVGLLARAIGGLMLVLRARRHRLGTALTAVAIVVGGLADRLGQIEAQRLGQMFEQVKTSNVKDDRRAHGRAPVG